MPSGFDRRHFFLHRWAKNDTPLKIEPFTDKGSKKCKRLLIVWG